MFLLSFKGFIVHSFTYFNFIVYFNFNFHCFITHYNLETQFDGEISFEWSSLSKVLMYRKESLKNLKNNLKAITRDNYN